MRLKRFYAQWTEEEEELMQETCSQLSSELHWKRRCKFFIDEVPVLNHDDKEPHYRYNPHEEVYLWSSTHHVLYPIDRVKQLQQQGHDVSHFDTPLVFPPNSYTQLIDESGFIYTPEDIGNTFIRSQRCVESCRFSTANKKLAVLREHFASCRHRNLFFLTAADPLGDLCALQLGSQM
ncbi:hypothetical protein BT69DRAFT_1352476 [Atractiella rhizophila]|nr:hypothetical protein BT69DRAFT_1352476 [Atractiella rhizophila]